jgi:type IV pilus assembly protein PilC
MTALEAAPPTPTSTPTTPTTWRYKARDGSGALVEGTVEADGASQAAQRVVALGVVPVEVVPAHRSVLEAEIRIPGVSGRITRKDVAVLTRQLATMVAAGLPLVRALTVITREAEKPQLRRVLEAVVDDVEAGRPLSDALSRHPNVFDRLFVAMVRAGEAGGHLDGVLGRLAGTVERQVELRRRIRSALAYPVGVAGLVVALFTGMLVFVVPMFEGMYADLDATLPVPTRILLAVSRGVTGWWWIIGPTLSLGVFGLARWRRTPAGRRRWDALALRAPLFGSLVHRSALARSATTLAALLRAGVPILGAMDIAAESAANAVVGDALRRAAGQVEQGSPLAAALRREDAIPSMLCELVAVGEETGAVDELLERAAVAYEQEVAATVEGLTSLLEPALVTLIGVGVGAMVIALYLPMFKLVEAVQ